MTEGINLLMVFGAGLAAVLSPCVLPVVPIVVAGPEGESRGRPLLVVAGLTVSFVAMGVVSTLFGAVIGSAMPYVEKIAAVMIVLFGVLLAFNVNPFKHLGILSRVEGGRQGRGMGGFVLGATLGIIWIPCIGPMLSAVLALVATKGMLAYGVGYLLVYSAGFSVPLLIAGYASHHFRHRMGIIRAHPLVYRIVVGGLLAALGVFIFTNGMVGFAAL